MLLPIPILRVFQSSLEGECHSTVGGQSKIVVFYVQNPRGAAKGLFVSCLSLGQNDALISPVTHTLLTHKHTLIKTYTGTPHVLHRQTEGRWSA